MSEAEIQVFRSVIRQNKVERYLEFGAGGSTVIASQLCKTVISVESNLEWANTVQDACPNAVFHIPDVGPVDEFGRPKNNLAHLWPNYYRTVWLDLDKMPQLVFIDGRFRVACALTALLYVRCPIMIHDFFRSEYHVVMDYLNLIQQEGELAVFEPRILIDFKKLTLFRDRYLFEGI